MHEAQIKVGDIERVIPDSYINLCKHSMNNQSAWKPSTGPNDENAMLGGRYVVRAVHETETGVFYDLTFNKNDSWPHHFVVLDKYVENCPFRVGDKVVYRPKCLMGVDLRMLEAGWGYSLHNPNQIYEVRYVLNDYYIFVDHEPDNPPSFPMRWIDFQKVETG